MTTTNNETNLVKAKALFAKKDTATSAENSDKPQAKMFINIGFPVEIQGEQQFVELPLSLTADNLDKAIETVRKRMSSNTPDNVVEIFEGKIAIAEAVQALFNVLPEGDEVLASDINPESEDFGFLSNLQVRFYHAKEKEAPKGVEEARKSVVSKFKAFAK